MQAQIFFFAVCFFIILKIQFFFLEMSGSIFEINKTLAFFVNAQIQPH